ncbi:MAG: sulfite exporter TauE/SafE family protein [Candidatus Jordarchaeaceae archaeon]
MRLETVLYCVAVIGYLIGDDILDWWLWFFLLNGNSGELWLYLLLGGVTVFTGIIAAMLGVGGGFLNVPIINYLANETINVAIGTSLFVIMFTSFSATLGYGVKRVIDFKLGLALVTTSIPGAFLGAFLTGLVREGILQLIFGIVLTIIGINMILKKQNQNPFVYQETLKEERKSIKSVLIWKRKIKMGNGETYEYSINLPLGLAFSFLAGLSSGLLGIGGGIVQVPVMNIILGVPMVVTVATSMFMIIFTSAFATFEHAMLGQVDWPVGIVMIIGAIIGAQIGCRITLKLNPQLLRKIFGSAMILIAIKMIYEALISL